MHAFCVCADSKHNKPFCYFSYLAHASQILSNASVGGSSCYLCYSLRSPSVDLNYM